MAKFTAKEKQIAEDSWETVRNNYYEAGVMWFGEFFKIDPSYTRWFDRFKEFPDQDILSTKGMRAHLLDEAMPAIGMIVRYLDKPDKMITYLTMVGNTHKGKGFDKKIWDDQRKALITTLKKTVGAKFTGEVQTVWDKILRYSFDELNTKSL